MRSSSLPKKSDENESKTFYNQNLEDIYKP